MALSNWDSWSVDGDGKSVRGALESFSGVQVSFYKNWIYVQDEKAWDKHGSFAKPFVMEIQSGELRYKDVTITAVRGPKEGIYAVIEAVKWLKDKEPERKTMIGIGCYGFKNEKWVGVEQAEIDFLRKWINSSTEESATIYDDDERPVTEKYTSHTFDERIRKIPLTDGLRFNQGDAYFADAMGEKIPATSPGEASVPTIMGMIKVIADSTGTKKEEE
jgi:hypothetical protein